MIKFMWSYNNQILLKITHLYHTDIISSAFWCYNVSTTINIVHACMHVCM